ncbi:hypothetical protein PoB_004737500 [Plakobranchus ocellatus]|uniref:AIG1-type G domain-containing protein n=1 Tax=Plakobranchus ocellatus TaxID=259542 RepID=A0AAV4BN62_9GAST|nr:hypothetical protein PoB_004737500 [Plakobranchus ocellatus]
MIVQETGLSLDAFQMFQNVIKDNLGSAHVFLIVCRYGERFTEEDRAAISNLRKNIWPKGFEGTYGIVVLTCGDVKKLLETNLRFLCLLLFEIKYLLTLDNALLITSSSLT